MASLQSKPIAGPEIAAEGAARTPDPLLRKAVICILLLEVALFVWSFGQFFCGDSLYYLWYRADSPARAFHYLTQADHLNSYRPLTYIVFSWLLFPLFGLNPLGYHFVTLGAHLLVTWLVYRLLRELVTKPAAALAGTLLFGVHATNFYITYDASFLPDFGSGLFHVATLLCYAIYMRTLGGGRWLAASLGSFIFALLFKESSITLPAGLLVVDFILRRRSCNRGGQDARAPRMPWWRPSPILALFAATGALYLAWLLHLKGGRLYPHGAIEPYALNFEAASLKLKLRYLSWLLNLPLQIARRGWTARAAQIAMVPALAWVIYQFARSARRVYGEVILCMLWALAGLLPVLFINQVPMKHNLYMPLVACAVALALMVQVAHAAPRQAGAPAGAPAPDGQAGLLPRGWVFFALGMSAATAFQVPSDLRLSWVGEASRIARGSVDAVKEAHPTLPRGAVLYVPHTAVRGMVSWYFQNGALFNLFYKDPTLRMRFADLGHRLPDDFAGRRDIFVFHFHDERLWDVTRQYRLDADDTTSLRLLEQVPRAKVETGFSWNPSEVPDNQDVTAVRPMARNGQSRQALLVVAGARVRFVVPPIPAGSVLQVGLSPAGPLKSGTRGRIFFQDALGGDPRPLLTATLDAVPDGRHWWDTELDLAPLAGRAGTFILETPPDQQSDWLAWSRLRIIQKSSRYFDETSRAVDRPLPPLEFRLIDRFEDADLRFDRAERYPKYDRFDTPDGREAFLYASRQGDPGHFAMVTIAGGSARFPLPQVPAGAALEVAAINLGELGDGVRGRVIVEDAAGSERIFDEMLPPRGKKWQGGMLSLAKWAGQPITLVFEGSSGPRRETIADWCAWGRLRIVTPSTGRR